MHFPDMLPAIVLSEMQIFFRDNVFLILYSIKVQFTHHIQKFLTD